MNLLQGTINSIQRSGTFVLIEITVDNQAFTSILLADISNKDLQVGQAISIGFKETEVALAKHLSGEISIRNRFKTTILNINKGEIVSEIKFLFAGVALKSIITTSSMERMDLKVGDDIEALIKSNEVSILYS